MSETQDNPYSKTRKSLKISESVWASVLGLAASAAQAKADLSSVEQGERNAKVEAAAELTAVEAQVDEKIALGADSPELNEEVQEETDALAAESEVIDPELLAELAEEEISAADSLVVADSSGEMSTSTMTDAQGGLFTGGNFLMAAAEAGAAGASAGGAGAAGAGAVAGAAATTAIGFDMGLLALLGVGAVAAVATSDNNDAPTEPAPAATVGGVAAKGLLDGATVFYDFDGDGKFSAGDPFGITTNGGKYSIDLTEAQKAQVASGVNKLGEPLKLVVSGGTDIINGKPFTGSLSSFAPTDTDKPVTISVFSTLKAAGMSDAALRDMLGGRNPDELSADDFDSVDDAIEASANKMWSLVSEFVTGDANAAAFAFSAVAKVLEQLAVSGDLNSILGNLSADQLNSIVGAAVENAMEAHAAELSLDKALALSDAFANSLASAGLFTALASGLSGEALAQKIAESVQAADEAADKLADDIGATEVTLSDAEAIARIEQNFSYDADQDVTLVIDPEATILTSTLADLQKLGVDSIAKNGAISALMGGMPIAAALPAFDSEAMVTLGVTDDVLAGLSASNISSDFFNSANVDHLEAIAHDDGMADGTELQTSLVNLQKMGVDSIVGKGAISAMLGGMPTSSALPQFDPDAIVTMGVTDAELSGFITAVAMGGAEQLANTFGNANVDYIGAVDGDFNMDAMTYSALTSHGLEFASNTSVTTSAGTELNINFADDSSSLG